MSGQGEGKDAKGRDYSQVTKDGSSAAGTLGSGGTGDVDRGLAGARSGASRQSARTDDLLAPDADRESRQGFAPGEEAGELQTGLSGIESLSTGKAGNRQSQE